MPAPAQAAGRDMVRDDPVGEGTAAERPSGAAPSAAMAEFEELLRRAIAAPPGSVALFSNGTSHSGSDGPGYPYIL